MDLFLKSNNPTPKGGEKEEEASVEKKDKANAYFHLSVQGTRFSG